MNIASPKPQRTVNGLDVDAIMQIVEDVSKDPGKAAVSFAVHSRWKGQTLSEHTVDSFTLAGQRVPRRFTTLIDEPLELLGGNSAPNPQEMLMSALNACVMVGYVAGAAVRGIALESLELHAEGDLDLRGFLGLDARVKPGYESIRYTVRIKGDGTAEQFREIHEHVMKTSPNYFNISQPVRIDATLEVVK